MFITPAYAQAAGGASGGFGLESLWIFVVIFAIMYLLIIRPQRKQLKKRQELLNSVRRGDSVVTGGGIVGKITRVYDDSGEVEVEIAENTRIRVVRSTLSDVRTRGEPISDTKTEITTKDKKRKKSSAKNADNAPQDMKQDTKQDTSKGEGETPS